MQARGRSFYIFCGMTVILVLVSIWALVSFVSTDEVTGQSEPLELDVVEADVPPASEILSKQFKPSEKPSHKVPELKRDEAIFLESLKDGAIPTQDVGERGSLEGALATNSPMVYAPSKYERLPDSPLLIFTDDMIWKEGDDTFVAKRDALVDQSKHIQEASVALSVSPRVEMEQTTGYRLVEIPQRTLFSKLGMVSGDVVVSINGTLPDMEPMALMFVNMAAGKQGVSTLVYEHRGEKHTIKLRASE